MHSEQAAACVFTGVCGLFMRRDLVLSQGACLVPLQAGPICEMMIILLLGAQEYIS